MSTFFRFISGMQPPRRSSTVTRRQQPTGTTENTQTESNNEHSSTQNEGNSGGTPSSQPSTLGKLSGRFKKAIRRQPLDRATSPSGEPPITDPEEGSSSKRDQGGDQDQETSTGNEPSKSKGKQAKASSAGRLSIKWKGKQATPKDSYAGEKDSDFSHMDPDTMSEAELALAMKLSQDEARRADSLVQDIQGRLSKFTEAFDRRRSESESQQEPEGAKKKAISFADDIFEKRDAPFTDITVPKPLDPTVLGSSSTQTQAQSKTWRSGDLDVVVEEKVTGLEGSTSQGSLDPNEPEKKSSQPAIAGPSKESAFKTSSGNSKASQTEGEGLNKVSKATGTSTEESPGRPITERLSNESLDKFIAATGLRDPPKPLLP